MPVAGQECGSCKDRQIELRERPKKLILSPTQTSKGKHALLCPYCDGEALEAALRAHKRESSQQDNN